MNKLYKMVDDIVITKLEDGYVIYQADKDRVHYLNHTAVLILEYCTGQVSEDEIVRFVQEIYKLEEPPEAEVKACLDSLLKEGVIQ